MLAGCFNGVGEPFHEKHDAGQRLRLRFIYVIISFIKMML